MDGPKLPLVDLAADGGSQPKADLVVQHIGRGLHRDQLVLNVSLTKSCFLA